MEANSEHQTMRPIELAKAIMHEKGMNFEQVFLEHVGDPSACVVVRPDLFGMAHVVEVPQPLNSSTSQPSLAWHVAAVVGRLSDLVGLLPFQLPFITFSRWKGAPKMRVYRTEEFINIARRSGRSTSTTQPLNHSTF